jgi:hypothetical protein
MGLVRSKLWHHSLAMPASKALAPEAEALKELGRELEELGHTRTRNMAGVISCYAGGDT